MEYINQKPIKLAKQLLAEQQNSITNVSGLCDFTDLNYFVRIYKKIERITPGVYRGCIKKGYQLIVTYPIKNFK